MRAGTPLTGAGFLGSRCVPFPVAGIRTPKSPLESGDACAPGTCGRGCPCALEMPACPARAHGSIQMQKEYVTAAAQCSQRKMPERVALTHHVSPRIHFVLEVLCAPGVSAVRFCSEVNHEKRKAPHWRGLHRSGAQLIAPCRCRVRCQLLTSGTIRP